MNTNQDTLFRYVQPRIMDQFIIVWFDTDINSLNETTSQLLTQLQLITNDIKTFSDLNECTDFITDVEDKQVLLIIPSSTSRLLLSFIEHVPLLYSIYIFQREHIHDDQWILGKNKVKGIFVEIESICKALKRDLCQLMNDSVPFSIVSTTCGPNLDELDQSFMYTTLLKEAILEIERDPNAPERFTRFFLNRVFDEPLQPEKIYEFQRCYDEHSPIWWYTKEKFVFSLLNQALRTQDTEFMIEMGFFLRDLHRDIECKYSETDKTTTKFVYRGQGLSIVDFRKIKERAGCLLSFNNFLSTTSDRQVAAMFAESNRDTTDNVGILFQMEVDPTTSSTPYALIQDESAFVDEKEVLFSMQSIFRIGEITEIQNRLWEVNLKLTSDNDAALTALTNYIRNEMKAAPGWYGIAALMIKMGKYEKAFEIYNALIPANAHDNSFEDPCLSLALDVNIVSTKHTLGKCPSALGQLRSLLEKSRDIFPADHIIFSQIWIMIGMIYYFMGDYKTSLSCLENSLEIQLRSSQSDHTYLAVAYQYMAATYLMMGDHMLALKNYEKALEIEKKSLPKNHPLLGSTYSGIGALYLSIGNNVSAIMYLEKSLKVLQKSVPPDHPEIAATHANLGMLQIIEGNYPTARRHLEMALKIQQKSLPETHANLGIIYNNLGITHQQSMNYSDALVFYKKAHKILQKSLPEDHSWLALNDCYIGGVYSIMGNYSKALIHLEKALASQQRMVTPNYQHLVATYSGFGYVYQVMGNFSKSKSNYEEAIDIWQKHLPSNHPVLSQIYRNLGELRILMGDYFTGCTNMNQMLGIQKQLHSARQSYSTLSVNNDISTKLNQCMDSFSEVFFQFGGAVENIQILCSSYRSPDKVTEQDFIKVYQKLKNLASAVSSSEKALQNQREVIATNISTYCGAFNNVDEQNQFLDLALSTIQITKKITEDLEKLPSEDPREIISIVNSIVTRHDLNEIILDVFESAEKCIDFRYRFLPSDNPTLAILYNSNGSQICSFHNHSLALLFYEKALERVLSRSPNNYQLLAKTYSNMATELDHLERHLEAIGYAEKAFQIAQSAFGMYHEETEFYQNQLHQLQRKA